MVVCLYSEDFPEKIILCVVVFGSRILVFFISPSRILSGELQSFSFYDSFLEAVCLEAGRME